LKERRLEIDASEPPVLRVLWDYCYNEMLRLEEMEEGRKLKFKWYHPGTKYFCDIGYDEVAVDPDWKPHAKNPAAAHTA